MTRGPRRWIEPLVLAALAFSPWLALRPAQAVDGICNGTSIGTWCNLRYDDPTVCQDCVWINCEVGCVGHGAQAYYYCVNVGFMWCLS